MKRLLYNFIRSISKKWNVDTISKISEKWRVIKSQWIAGKMAEAGDGVFFKYVAQLHDHQFIRIGNNSSFGKDLYLTAWCHYRQWSCRTYQMSHGADARQNGYSLSHI